MEAKLATKVSQVESYKDSQGEHLVVKGKLVLIKEDIKEPKLNYLIIKNDKTISLVDKDLVDMFEMHKQFGDFSISNGAYYKPIIISETEEKLEDEKYFDLHYRYIRTYETGFIGYKILALPEQFSPKHLQAIVDRKLKNGDEVYVECEVLFIPSNAYPSKQQHINFIKLTNNHIKLFPVKQEESWDDINDDFGYSKVNGYTMNKLTKEQLQWLKDNYNPPTKK